METKGRVDSPYRFTGNRLCTLRAASVKRGHAMVRSPIIDSPRRRV